MGENMYLTSVTRIRALETKLLSKNDVARLVDAKDAEEVIKILNETDYAGSISEMNGIEDYETILDKEISKCYKLIKEISPVPELTNIFMLKYDIHNLKVLLKSDFLGEENDALLSDIGTISVDKLKEMVKGRDFRFMPFIIKEGIEEAINSFTVDKNPQMIDIILDKCLYNLMFTIAEESGDEFLKEYVGMQIDLNNIKSFIRIKAMGYGRDLLKRAVLDNGKVDFDYLSEIFEEPVDILTDKMSYKEYHSVIEEGITDYVKTKSITRFEKLADDFLFEIAKRGKYVPAGIEALVGYMAAKENEVKIIRIIMVGKINEIPNELIRERLRDVYV